jgi:hypothetical protein
MFPKYSIFGNGRLGYFPFGMRMHEMRERNRSAARQRNAKIELAAARGLDRECHRVLGYVDADVRVRE